VVADPRLRLWRLVVFLVPASLYLFSNFHRVAPAVVATDLMRAFALDAATLGSLAAIYPYTFTAMALVAGSLVDTLGPRWTLTAGCLTMAGGAAVFGLAPAFPVAVAARLLVAVGASVILIAWLSLLAEWFRPDQFATLSGSTQGVGNVGALLASTPLALAVEALGWRQTFVLIGVLTALFAALSALLIRDRPEALGLPPVTARPARAATLLDVLRDIPAVIGNARTWPPVLAAGSVYATLIAFLGLWGMPYLTQVYGFTRVHAATTLAFLALGLIVGSPFVGWLSDRWLARRRLPFAVFALLYAACWLPLALPSLRPSPAMLPGLLFVMGLVSTGFVLVWACVREVNDPGRVGIAMGFCNMPIFLAFALLQWLLGVILDARWQGLAVDGVRIYAPAAYEAAFTVCLGVAAGGVVLAWLVTETRCRNVWRAGHPDRLPPPGSSRPR
jgi:sugar phosphate permease